MEDTGSLNPDFSPASTDTVSVKTLLPVTIPIVAFFAIVVCVFCVVGSYRKYKVRMRQWSRKVWAEPLPAEPDSPGRVDENRDDEQAAEAQIEMQPRPNAPAAGGNGNSAAGPAHVGGNQPQPAAAEENLQPHGQAATHDTTENLESRVRPRASRCYIPTHMSKVNHRLRLQGPNEERL
ncbi:hypothetical protein R1flu_003592 [Riccia fluitans]|uniref:Uncharacterized protein n=1 Tax=Riccia fluitans TaxID=41844 RepID=A0ABD1YCW0_9MARC